MASDLEAKIREVRSKIRAQGNGAAPMNETRRPSSILQNAGSSFNQPNHMHGFVQQQMPFESYANFQQPLHGMGSMTMANEFAQMPSSSFNNMSWDHVSMADGDQSAMFGGGGNPFKPRGSDNMFGGGIQPFTFNGQQSFQNDYDRKGNRHYSQNFFDGDEDDEDDMYMEEQLMKMMQQVMHKKMLEKKKKEKMEDSGDDEDDEARSENVNQDGTKTNTEGATTQHQSMMMMPPGYPGMMMPPYNPYGGAQPVNPFVQHAQIDPALAAKLEMVIEQNKQLQTAISQQGAGYTSTEPRRKAPPRKKKKKRDNESSGEEEEDAPAPQNDPTDLTTYEFNGDIVSGGVLPGSKSEQYAETEKWFITQFAGRKSKRRSGLIGGKVFADTKVAGMHDVLNLGDEDEISFDEKKKEEVVKKQESKDDMRRQLEKKLGIVQVRKPRWRYFWKSMPDLASGVPGKYSMQWSGHCLDEEEGMTCVECREKHPRYVKVDMGDQEPLPETIMSGKSLFKSLCTVSMFLTRLKIVDRNRRKDSVEKDREAFKEFLLLYYDKIRNWLGKVVKAPVSSLVVERAEKYRLDTKEKDQLGGIKKIMSKLSGGGGHDSKERRLMQLKVRVKGIIDQLLAAAKTRAEGASRSSNNIPKEIVDFLAKYFASDNVAWPTEYLWRVEEDEMEFTELGLTRRTIFKHHEDTEEGDGKADIDTDSDDEDVQFKMVDFDTSKVRRLVLNFLVGRVLINHVIVRPGDVASIGVRSYADDFSWNGLRVKKNLRLLASLMWLILRRVQGHTENVEASNNGTFVMDGNRDPQKEKSKKKQQESVAKKKEKVEQMVVEYKKDEIFEFEIEEGGVVKDDPKEESVSAAKGIKKGDTIVKVGTVKLKGKPFKDIQSALLKNDKKRPIKVVFEKKETEENEDKGNDQHDEGKKPKSGETPDKYTSLWLKEAEIEGMLFDETHFIFGSEDHIEEFVEWVEDEATRLTIFGDRIVEEILLAKERMKKEEAEEKNEKSVGPTPPT
jgi:hypothetical protein